MLSPLGWFMLIVGIVGVLGFVMVAGHFGGLTFGERVLAFFVVLAIVSVVLVGMGA
jgi:uncharacterized membrane protein